MNLDFPEDSDSSDEDYMPAGAATAGDVPSEVDSDGDPEDPLSDAEDAGTRGTKRKKKTTKSKKKSKTESQGSTSESTESSPKKVATEEDKKKHADSLWASFKKDTGFKNKTETTTEPVLPAKKSETVPTPSKPVTIEPNEKVKITQIFEFAGEEVKVEKEVAANSAEARLVTKASSSAPVPARGRGRGGLGGIGSVLSQLGKKQKLSTLEKSQLDWNRFKKSEKIEEELENHKKGKDSYLERQDFLQRADLRRFEIEKEVRTIERNKRMNNVQ